MLVTGDSRRAVEHRAALLGHLRRGHSARVAGRRREHAGGSAHEGAGRARARGLRELAEGFESRRRDDTGRERRAGADPLRRARSGHAARERRRSREDAAGEPPHRRARLRPHRVAARLRTAAHRRVHRRSDLRHASRVVRRALREELRGRRCGPTGSARARDRRRQRGEGLRPARRGARGRRRLVHGRRRRDHGTARPQRRRQDHAAADARDADDPGCRQREHRRARRRARPLRRAPAHRRAVRRARPLPASYRPREHPLLRRVARLVRRRARRADRRARRRAGHRRHRRPPRAGLFAGRADEGGDRARAGPRPADHPARRAHQRPRHHEHSRAARPAARIARGGQVPALQLARDAGSLGAVRFHRDPRPRTRRRDRNRRRAARAVGQGSLEEAFVRLLGSGEGLAA